MPRRLTLRSETLTELATTDLMLVQGGQDTVNGCITGSPTRCGTLCELIRDLTDAQIGTLPTGLTDAC